MRDVEIGLNYGRGTLAVGLPDELDVTVVTKRPMKILDDPAAAIADALTRPVGSIPLADAARGARSACILVCDVTRPVPNGLFLPPLIRTLLDAGIAPEAITVLVATGLHRPNEGAELAEVIGDPWVMDTVVVANHIARDADAHVDLGVTPTRGTPVSIDRRFVEADVRIATGLVEPHFMAGYSGGRKVIAPGVAGAPTITTFHSARFMEHPSAANCVLDGNPLHEEQLEIVRMVGGAFALNTVIDDERRLCFVNFGEIVESHLAAVEFIRAAAEIEVGERFHTVVTSAAGYPLDTTYYQTVKGMVGALGILEPGGDLIVASACEQGFGSSEFAASQRRLVEIGPERFLDEIGAKQYAAIDEWQTEMLLKALRAGRVHLYSDGLTPADRAITGVETTGSVAEAVLASVGRSGDRSSRGGARRSLRDPDRDHPTLALPLRRGWTARRTTRQSSTRWRLPHSALSPFSLRSRIIKRILKGSSRRGRVYLRKHVCAGRLAHPVRATETGTLVRPVPLRFRPRARDRAPCCPGNGHPIATPMGRSLGTVLSRGEAGSRCCGRCSCRCRCRSDRRSPRRAGRAVRHNAPAGRSPA